MSVSSQIKNEDQSSDVQSSEFLTAYVANQTFGIPILQIQDVIADQPVTQVPLAPEEVSGSLNLRGRIVTSINLRKSLALEREDGKKPQKKMGVVVEHNHELYSLVVDGVGDVLALSNKYFESTPPTLDALWRNISTGVFRLDEKLLIILDIPKLLDIIKSGDGRK